MIEQKEVAYAKEVGDVGAALVFLLQEIKAKKPIGELAAESLPKLIDAVAGADTIKDELTANRKASLATMGYHSGEMVDALLT